MLERLKNLLDSTHSNIFGQVLKSKKHADLYEWVMQNTRNFTDMSIKGRCIYLLDGSPDLNCKYGNLKKIKQDNSGVGFCGSIANCQCFKDQMSEYASQHTDIQDLVQKRVATWQQKYGCSNASKSDIVKQKRKDTMSQRDYSDVFTKMQHKKETAGFNQVVSRMSADVIPNFTRQEYKGSLRKNVYSWKCVHCDTIFSGVIESGKVPRCKTCFPPQVSTGEKEVRQYVEQLGCQTISGDRTILDGLEIDIYIPSKKVAIEFNGVYWHSDKFRTPTYHVDKFLKCKQQGIRLIQLFDDEWKMHPDIVKSRLASVMGVGNRIFARKCVLSEIGPLEYKDFVESHHLQGYTPSPLRYGLKYAGELVAVMGFGRSRYTSHNYEMIRFCSIGNVVGGAGKLFSHFVLTHSPSSVVSYANRCWSDGGLYQKLGFTDCTTNESNAGYFYVKNSKRYHRSNFTKKRLVSMGYDPSLTEDSIMRENGYVKVHDCGNYKFVWTNPNLGPITVQ